MVGSANMTDRAGLGLPPWMRLPGKMVSWKTLKLSSLKAYSKLRVIGGSGKLVSRTVWNLQVPGARFPSAHMGQ